MVYHTAATLKSEIKLLPCKEENILRAHETNIPRDLLRKKICNVDETEDIDIALYRCGHRRFFPGDATVWALAQPLTHNNMHMSHLAAAMVAIILGVGELLD